MTTTHFIYTLISLLALIGLYVLISSIDARIKRLRSSIEPGSKGPYHLLGQSYPTYEACLAAAKAHPQWETYRMWDKTAHCGCPDMDNASDRIEFEAFVAKSN